MDVAFMPIVADVPAAAPQKGSGKTAASQGEDSGGFGSLFAGLVAADQPVAAEGSKTAAETATAGETAPGFIPGMWNFVPLATLMANAGQAPVSQTAQEATGAITALTAAGQQAKPGMTPLTPPLTALTASAAHPQAAAAVAQTGQQAGTVTTQQVQQMPSLTTEPAMSAMQTTPATAAMPAAAPVTTPVTTPVATVPMPAMPVMATPVMQTDIQPTAVPTAQTAPVAADASKVMTTAIPVEAAQQPVTPASAATAAVANGPRLPEKSAPAPATATTADATAPDQSPTPATAIPVTAGSEASAAGDDGSAFTAENFTPAAPNAAPPPETATVNQVFAAIVDQTASPAAANARTASSETLAQPGPDPHNVAGQIVDHARLITRAENSEMVIRLKPEHLGELTLKIVVDSGAVSATFHTASAEVRAALEASLPQLKQDMANQGLKVDNVGVYASLDHFFANDQRHAPQQQLPQTARRHSGDEVFADSVAAATALGSMTASSGGIDYRV